jgi:L-lactate dehydrogenase complex protein LldE
VYELSELLVHRLGTVDVGASFPHRVAYHPTCHSLRVTRVGDAPLRLLRHVRGLELVDLPRADECCGFGGTFSVKNADTSSAMLADKCAALESTGADVCTAVDGSCLLQIGGGLSRRRSAVRAMHLAEILAAT